MIKIMLIAGARPNFMKIAPIARSFNKTNEIQYKILHTGQHYDQNMSDIFFEELGIRNPDYHLGAGGGTHAQHVITSYSIHYTKLYDNADLYAESYIEFHWFY